METSTEKIVNLTTSENKEKFFNAKKKSIKNESEIKLDFTKIDFINLEKTTSKLKANSTSNKGNFMYKFELMNNLTDQQKKSLRRKIRSKRKDLISSFLKSVSLKDKDLILKSFKEFKTFYFKNCIVNDFTINSIASKNSDKETIELIVIFLNVVKQLNLL